MDKRLITGGFVVLFFVVIFIAGNWSRDKDLYAGLKCPDDYATSAEQQEGFQKFVDIYTENFPEGSNAELMLARGQFYINNNCTAAIQRMADYDAGNIPPDVKSLVDDAARQLIEQDEERSSK